MSGVSREPMFEFVSNVLLFQNGQRHRDMRGRWCGPLRIKLLRFSARLFGSVQRRWSNLLLAKVRLTLLGIRGTSARPGDGSDPRRARRGYTCLYRAGLFGDPRLVACRLSLVPPEIRADSDADLDGLTGYVDRVLEARRSAPVEDVISDYLAKVADGPLIDVEIRSQIVGLILAWFGHHTRRFGIEARKVDGVLLPKGTLIATSMLTVLRDPEIYQDPDQFDIARTDHP